MSRRSLAALAATTGLIGALLVAVPQSVQATPPASLVQLTSGVAWTIPAGVQVVRVTISGAPGGEGDYTSDRRGSGGKVAASLLIGAASTVTALLGSPGGGATAASAGAGGAGGTPAVKGGNGGPYVEYVSNGGGGGGGGSVLRVGAVDAVVAPGGGGSGASDLSCTGGVGGTPSATDDTAGSGTAGCDVGSEPGGAGGAGAGASDGVGTDGGGPPQSRQGGSGGGGGGGFLGGLGGGGGSGGGNAYPAGGGGGSGSAWVKPSLTTGLAATTYDTAASAEARIEFVVFRTTSLANAEVGSSYNLTVDAGFGAGACSFGITYSAANLPAGLSMDANGVIGGTPTAAGTSTVTITATKNDVNTHALARSVTDFSLTVDPRVEPSGGTGGGAGSGSSTVSAPTHVTAPTPTSTVASAVAPVAALVIHRADATFATGSAKLTPAARRAVASTSRLAPASSATVVGSIATRSLQSDKQLARKRVAAVVGALRGAGFTGSIITSLLPSTTKGGSRRVTVTVTEPTQAARRLTPRGC